ncbi:MAG TPA: TetR/AcrR family transcriptional regulator [Acidimicrobiia bacterium]
MTSESTVERVSARERLLQAASELFYAEGVHIVGVDRLVERAGVAKATLYTLFGNKDGLVRAYLTERHDATRRRMDRELATRFDTPRQRLLGVFEVQGQSFTEPGFHGCAFVGANAESSPGTSVEEVTDDYRNWVHSLFVDLATQAGATDPETLARQLVLLYDGAGISAWMDHDPTVANTARTVAAALIDSAIPGEPTRSQHRVARKPKRSGH